MADFETHLAELEELETQVVGLSSDPREDARGTVDELGLEFSVAWGLDAEATSRAIGCYTGTHEGRPHIQPAAFVLDRDGTIVHAVYSSGKVGRLTAEDALAIVKGLAGD